MKELLTTLFRRKRAFLTFFLCMIAMPMALAYIMSPKYLGKATLLLTAGREKKPFLPDEADSRTSYMQVSMEDVGSEVELLTSQPVLAKVVEANHLDQDDEPPASQRLKHFAWKVSKGIHSAMVGIGLKPDISPTEDAIDQLRRKVDVDFVKRTNIITIKWKGPTPELARDVVNSLVDAYLWHHIKVHGNAYVLSAVKKEMEESGDRLRAAQDSLTTYTKLNSISDVESQRSNLLEKLGQAENKVQLMRSASHRNLSPDVLGSLSEDPAISELSKKLTDAEMGRIDLDTRYAGDDRRLVASKQQIDQLRNLIVERADRSQKTWAALAETYRKELAVLDAHKVKIDRLKQEIEDLNRIFQLNRGKVDEIMISQAMDRAAMSAARVVEYAVANQAPAFPKRLPLLIISIFFGLVFGTVYAVSLDKLSLRVLSVADVEQATKLPVLASLPEITVRNQADKEAASELLARDLFPVGTALFGGNGRGPQKDPLHSVLITSPSAGAGTSYLAEHLGRLLAMKGPSLLLSFVPGEPVPAQLAPGQVGVKAADPEQADLVSASTPGFALARYLVKDGQSSLVRLNLCVKPGQISLYDDSIGVLWESLRAMGARYLIIDAGSDRGDTLYLKFLSMVEHVLVVTAYDVTSKPALVRMVEIIRRHQGKIAGCVFNRRRDVIPNFLYQRLF